MELRLVNTSIFLLLMFLFINGCAAVRMAGKISRATGDIMVQSADEEESKSLKQSNTADDKQLKITQENPTEIKTINKKYTSVKVRSGPSIKKTTIATLTGGDKVEKISEDIGWLKIRFATEDKQGEGWIKKELVE